MAGDLTIVQADRFVELGETAPENVVTPGIFVDMILNEERGAESHG